MRVIDVIKIDVINTWSRAIAAASVILGALILTSCGYSYQPDTSDRLGVGFSGEFAPSRLTAESPTEFAFFGASIAVREDVAAIGAWGEADRGRNTGAVYVFDRTGDEWIQRARLTASDAAAGDRFGHSVAIGNRTILVGAVYDDAVGFRSGSVYVYERVGDVWYETERLHASDSGEDAYFGIDVALNGETAIVGASGPGARVAYIFRNSAEGWYEEAKLVPSALASEARFGESVAIFGDTAVVGASVPELGEESDEGLAANHSSASYVFGRVDGQWIEHAKLTAFDLSDRREFGRAVAIDDGIIAIGAPGERGRVYVFRWTGSFWDPEVEFVSENGILEHFAIDVAVDAEKVVVAAPGYDHHTGTAYIFRRADNSWQRGSRILAPPDAVEGIQLGSSVAVDGGTIFVGATGEQSGGIASGAAYGYR